MAAEPNPDSLENTPRATPIRTAAATTAPANPPVAVAGVKAWVKIRPMASGTLVMLMAMISNAAPR